jgi:hypothetical protein
MDPDDARKRPWENKAILFNSKLTPITMEKLVNVGKNNKRSKVNLLYLIADPPTVLPEISKQKKLESQS